MESPRECLVVEVEVIRNLRASELSMSLRKLKGSAINRLLCKCNEIEGTQITQGLESTKGFESQRDSKQFRAFLRKPQTQ